jgi:hypothetical protein
MSFTRPANGAAFAPLFAEAVKPATGEIREQRLDCGTRPRLGAAQRLPSLRPARTETIVNVPLPASELVKLRIPKAERRAQGVAASGTPASKSVIVRLQAARVED